MVKLEEPERFEERLQSHTVGRHTVVLGDCIEQLRSVSTHSVDVIVTSPPYNIGAPYKTYEDSLPRRAYLKWLTHVSGQLERVLKPDGSFFLNVGTTNLDPWLAFDAASSFRNEFRLQNNIVWVKSVSVGDNTHGHFKPINSKRFLNQNHETVFHFSKTGSVSIDRLAVGVPFKDKSNIARWGHESDKRCAGNVWFIPYTTVRSKAQKFNHPAGFPVELPTRCLMLHGGADLLVLDPFVGAGTTLVAAQRLGHRSIGIDVDPQYVKTSVSRLEVELGNDQRHAHDRRGRAVARRAEDCIAHLP